jgi:radical SAM protein with 4Fe4S-binding SPASM domain
MLPVVARRTATAGVQNSCFFRSGPQEGGRKALVQITQRCDLHCAHCFVSATRLGSDIPAASFTSTVMSRFHEARVANVTLTGGEPFVHPDLLAIAERFVSEGMDVTICTNGVSVSEPSIQRLRELERVQVNVSLDGSTEHSHGRFRGDRKSFHATIRNARALSEAELLKGILCTPNALATPDEYASLQALAAELNAAYLLMNPLSSFGRGIKARARLQADADMMVAIHDGLRKDGRPARPELVFVRFPNQPEPLAGCIAGEIFYIFVNGNVTVCPYLVFAAENPRSQHAATEFIVGNLFEDADIAARLDGYRLHERYSVGGNASCGSCDLSTSCGKGCPAAVIAGGGRIGDLDADVCPVANEGAIAACS